MKSKTKAIIATILTFPGIFLISFASYQIRVALPYIMAFLVIMVLGREILFLIYEIWEIIFKYPLSEIEKKKKR